METVSSISFPYFEKTLELLKRLCWEKRSGVLFMVTEEGHAATIAISRGNIIDVFHMMKGGWEAITLLSNVERAAAWFKNDTRFRDNPVHHFEVLPKNEVIFNELSKSCYGVFPHSVVPKHKSILVVEDSGLARKAVVGYLSGHEYLIYEAKDGLEAIDMVRKIKPDLVLLDLILPKMDGYQVLDNIRNDKDCKNTKVIALTSRDTLFDKLKGKMSGTNEYLTKPVDQEELVEKVKYHIG